MNQATDDQGLFPTGFYQVKPKAEFDMKTKTQIIPKITPYFQILWN